MGDVQKGVRNHKVRPAPRKRVTRARRLTTRARTRQNLESNSTALLVFGNGDGGGGPLAKMLENVRVASRARAVVAG